MEKKKKKNRSHPIPKEQQIPQTANNQLFMVYFFLEGKAFNTITTILDTDLKRYLRENGVKLNEIKAMEGRAVERKTCRLFKGKVKQKKRGESVFVEQLPLFDRLPDRTGHPFHKNEIRCFKIAIKWNRSIAMISRLTGRSEKEVQETIDRILGKNRKPLFDEKEGNLK